MTTCGADSAAGLRSRAEALVLRVPTQTHQVAPTRRAVHDYLTAHAVPAPVADDVRLVTSELVTNAIMHGRPVGAVRVHVELTASTEVVLEVSNEGPVAGIPPVDAWNPAPALAANGRGLGIVRRLCDTVEVRGDDHIATVVCRRRWHPGEQP